MKCKFLKSIYNRLLSTEILTLNLILSMILYRLI